MNSLMQNAGTASAQVPIEDTSLETFQRVISVNLVGTFLCTREAVRIFKSQSPQGGTSDRVSFLNTSSIHVSSGRIVNNGSISAYTPRPHSSPYTSTKHAVLGMTKSTALDGRAFNITCTQVDIGDTLLTFHLCETAC